MLVEKKVTLAVVFAVITETAGILVWAGIASEKLREVEARIAAQTVMGERLARVEAHLDAASAQLDRIEKKLEARGR
jgi:hypothetical protein